MTERGYPAARTVAATVEASFARLRAGAKDPAACAPHPDADAIEAIANAAFWASLRREEGRTPQISLAFLPPDRAGAPLAFEQPLPLTPEALARLAPAVERPGIHLGVWRDGAAFVVWGATRTLPDLCLVLEVFEPGLLVVKYSRSAAFVKYGNLAVLRGDEVQVIDEACARRPDAPVLLASLVGLDPPGAWLEAANVLVRLAVSMRGTGHGGALLVVPEGTERWRDSIVWPIPYRVHPSFTHLAALVRQAPEAQHDPAWQQATRRTIDAIAGLTAVDGATIISTGYELLAFGAKIGRARGAPVVEQVLMTEPVAAAPAAVVEPARIGGTRHLSAAQFVHDQRDALALVASQDGRFTIFTWSVPDGLVHAYRVEALLL
jgi:hypothetical protein